jgi:predicted  nucleic acid-binding Zn-ribbon protein
MMTSERIGKEIAKAEEKLKKINVKMLKAEIKAQWLFQDACRIDAKILKLEAQRDRAERATAKTTKKFA